jgi:comEA protein
MTLRERLSNIFRKVQKLSEQLYTPRELRAIGMFLLLGIAVLLYRHGKQLYTSSSLYSPTPQERVDQHRRDSLFFALSAAANARDSLFFSLPEDSLEQASIRRKESHHSKTDGLRLASISLNAGTKEDLCRLPTIGPASAEKILEYRAQRGHFRSLAELKNVRGFGEVRFEKLKRFLRLD